jgi:hypothetical protein
LFPPLNGQGKPVWAQNDYIKICVSRPGSVVLLLFQPMQWRTFFNQTHWLEKGKVEIS